MQVTRQQILDYLRVQHGATVKDLGRVMRLTATGIRQHLTILEQEGLVERDEVRGRVGRPALHYRLSTRGESLYPKQYHRLASALLEEVCDEVGAESMPRLLRNVAVRLAHELAPDLAAGEQGAERLESITQALRTRDIACDWESDGDDALLLHQRSCPYPEVARRNSITCALDVALVRELSGMDARLVECILRDDACCTYRLSHIPDAGGAVASTG